MTRKSRRALARALDDVRDDLGGTGAAGIHFLSDSGGDEYLTPEAYEEYYGHPPEESPGLVVRIPAAAGEY